MREMLEQRPRIISNKIKCKKCGDIIESKSPHDFKWCKCESCAVDGGREYLKRCYKLKDDIEDLSVIERYIVDITEVMNAEDGVVFRIPEMNNEEVIVIECDGINRLFEKETGRRILMASDYLSAKYELVGYC